MKIQNSLMRLVNGLKKGTSEENNSVLGVMPWHQVLRLKLDGTVITQVADEAFIAPKNHLLLLTSVDKKGDYVGGPTMYAFPWAELFASYGSGETLNHTAFPLIIGSGQSYEETHHLVAPYMKVILHAGVSYATFVLNGWAVIMKDDLSMPEGDDWDMIFATEDPGVPFLDRLNHYPDYSYIADNDLNLSMLDS